MLPLDGGPFRGSVTLPRDTGGPADTSIPRNTENPALDRRQISLNTFIDTFLSSLRLTPSERSAVDRVHQAETAAAAYRAAEDLLGELADRGALRILEEGHNSQGNRTLLIRHPNRRARARLVFPETDRPAGSAPEELAPTPPPPPPSTDPEVGPEVHGPAQPAHRSGPDGDHPPLQRVPLPLPEALRTGVPFDHVRELLAAESGLVAHDRVTTPREITARLEYLLGSLWEDVDAAFHPVVMPPGDVWPGFDGTVFPVDRSDLQRLASHRDHVLLAGRGPRRPPLLLVGMGDDRIGWSALLSVAQHGEPDASPPHVDDERISLVTLVAEHFESLLTNVFRLQGLIFYDFLTGIYNRAFFEEQIEREIRLSRRRGQSLGLLIVDIDDFKAFNTKYGYDGGDRALATVACVLKSVLRGTDTLARYGGEEFAVILAPPIPLDEAHRIAERLRHAVEQEPFHLTDLEGHRIEQRITVSIGGAIFPDAGSTPRDLWSAANRQVLTAKATGKNRVCFAEPVDPSISPG